MYVIVSIRELKSRAPDRIFASQAIFILEKALPMKMPTTINSAEKTAESRMLSVKAEKNKQIEVNINAYK